MSDLDGSFIHQGDIWLLQQHAFSFRIHFKRLLITCKAINYLTPKYLTELLTPSTLSKQAPQVYQSGSSNYSKIQYDILKHSSAVQMYIERNLFVTPRLTQLGDILSRPIHAGLTAAHKLLHISITTRHLQHQHDIATRLQSRVVYISIKSKA